MDMDEEVTKSKGKAVKKNSDTEDEIEDVIEDVIDLDAQEDAGICSFLFLIFTIILKYYIDFQTAIQASLSVFPLEGSSRTMGGTSRGRAIGNQPNIANTDDEEENAFSFRKQPDGVIRYCNHSTISPPFNRNVEFGFIHKVHTGRSVRSLLMDLGRLFESIQCKSFSFLIYIYSIDFV